MPKPDPRQHLFDVLEGAVHRGAVPGCVALVQKRGAIAYHEAHGVVATHPAAPEASYVERDTRYDLASLTKIVATTTLFAQTVACGKVALDAVVPEPWRGACPGATAADLLEHAGGLTAHVEYFGHVDPHDAEAVLAAVAATRPACLPKTRTIYSDLGFMLLGAWLERIHDAPLDDVFTTWIAGPLGLTSGDQLGYRRLPRKSLGRHSKLAPTEIYDATLWPHGEPSYFRVRQGLAHGEVHDDNAFVMGGVAGHAGLFGHAMPLLQWARGWLDASLPGMTPDVRDRFWTASTVPESTRRLGFDGVAGNDTGSTAGALGPDVVGHLGYTGTSLWISPKRDEVYILLSNRVHPTRDNDAILELRREFHSAAAEL